MLSYLTNLFDQIDFSNLTGIVLRVAGVFLCLTIHESSHGLAAWVLGDPAAKREHRRSLIPLRHIDLLGLLMMFFVGFGWAKPVPVDMRYFKNPKSGMAITALAGPASNFVLAIFLLLGCSLMDGRVIATPVTLALYQFLFTTAFLSVGLGTFNLIPIPPLDGSKVLFSFLPDSAYARLMYYERYGMIVLLLLAVTNVGNGVLSALMTTVFRALMALTGLAN